MTGDYFAWACLTNWWLEGKSMAAHRCGITKIVIPKANVKDLDDIPETVKENVTFIPVEKVSQVLDAALVK